MTKRFQQTLFIAHSQESANFFLQQTKGAIKAQTLSPLLTSLGEQKGNVLNSFNKKLYFKR